MKDAIKNIAKRRLGLGFDPLKVHEWLMRQGAEIEEADEITGCKTTQPGDKATCATCDGTGRYDCVPCPDCTWAPR